MHLARRAVTALLLSVFAFALVFQAGCERKSDTGEAKSAAQAEKQSVGVLPEGAKAPDVIFILVDAMRADRLGAYGNSRRLSPIMDQIAAQGVTFEQCQSAAPWTLPSVATLFTSYYPGVHKATSYRAVEDMEQGKRAEQSVLSDGFTTLAEVLQANGYQTAGFVAAKFLRSGYGFGQGFEHYDTSFADNTVPGGKVNEAFLKWYDEKRDASKPMFAYLHYMDVHGPYNADPKFLDPLMKEVEARENKTLLQPDQFRRLNAYLRQPPPKSSDPTRFERLKGYREYWEARYDAGVAEMNFYLAQLVAELKQRGVWDDAYVILTADHGEALCEHDYWGHGYSLYQTDMHVPLIMRWPGVLPEKTRVRRLASLIDVMPTLIEQLRLQAESADELQGSSLAPHIAGTAPDAPIMRFAEAVKSGPRQYSLYVDVTKLLVTQHPSQKMPDGTMSKPRVSHQMFNLVTDSAEMFDISKQFAAQVKELGRLLGKMVQINLQTKPADIMAPKAVDNETIAQLEAIGYAGGMDEEEEEEAEIPAPATAPASEPEGDGADAP